MHSVNGDNIDDFKSTEKPKRPEIKDNRNGIHQTKTTESISNLSTICQTTTVTACIEEVSLSVNVTSNEKIINNNIDNDKTNANGENVNESFDADATGDDNDSILASVASIDDKDKLIEFLTNKLMEKNRKESEMSHEIERLRNLLK